MSFEFFIASRYLLTQRRQSFISVISLFSMLGVGIGVASLIVVLGVMSGFSNDLRDKILGVNAHSIVTALGGPMRAWQGVAQKISGLEGVSGVTPFIYSEVMLSSGAGVKGVALRGIDAASAGTVLSLPHDMVVGSLSGLTENGETPGIVLGKDLADRLGLRVGSQVNLMSPSGRQGAAGFTPKVRVFILRGLFKTGMYEYDSSLAYVSLGAAQDLLGFKADLVSGLELRLSDVYEAPKVAREIRDKLPDEPLHVRTWMDMNGNLFAALQLEKTAMFVILVMIVLVGSFSIVTSLVMLVTEKTKDIAILVSMGATARSIRRIFILQGGIIGLVGTALGYALGLPLCLLLEKYQFIKLPSDVYPMDHLPIRLEWLDLSLVGVVALGLCFLATLYPANQAARLRPVEALRHE